MIDLLLRSLLDSPSEITRRFVPDLEVRADPTGRTVTGIVVPYERVARVSDGGPAYDEMFRMGAFDRTIKNGDVRRVKLLSQHMAGRNPLGRALSLREDPAGLYGEFMVSKTREGDDTLELIRDGALDSFSVGFRPINLTKENGVTIRTEVALREVSLVTFPAYEDARIAAVRSRLDHLTDDELNRLLSSLDLGATTPDEDSEHLSATTPLEDSEPVGVRTANASRIAWSNFRASLTERGIR